MANSILRKARLLLIISLVALILCGCAKTETFSEVTGKRDGQISYVASNDGVLSKKETKKLLIRYRNAKFRRWTGSLGNTVRTVYRFYDSNGQIIFEAEELGNRNLVTITTGDNEATTYQLSDREK